MRDFRLRKPAGKYSAHESSYDDRENVGGVVDAKEQCSFSWTTIGRQQWGIDDQHDGHGCAHTQHGYNNDGNGREDDLHRNSDSADQIRPDQHGAPAEPSHQGIGGNYPQSSANCGNDERGTNEISLVPERRQVEGVEHTYGTSSGRLQGI